MSHSKHLPYRKGVGIALFNQQGLIWRGRRQAEHSWQMPQGGIEHGETPHEASLRELEEETGITPVKIVRIDHLEEPLFYDFSPLLRDKVFEGRYRGQSLLWFAFLFQGEDKDIHLPDEGEFDAWDWCTPSQLIADVVAFRKPMYEKVLATIKGA